jgi:predicted MFS family arabinose efflux permease
LQPIKIDLRLSDTRLGLLTGIAFGLFYAMLGLPIARWADRGNRVIITAVAIGLWGVTVMSCLFVKTFPQLMLARIAAAVGEAGCMPPTYSLLADYFPTPSERIKAMTVYWLASPLSALLSFTAGGYLNDRYGWRVAFFVIGIPGLIGAALVALTIREPRSTSNAARTKGAAHTRPSICHMLIWLWRQPTLKHLAAAYVLLLTVALGLAPWYAAFMMRSHGLSTSKAGLCLGWIFGGGGVVGILLGGYITDRLLRSEAGQVRVSAISMALVFPLFGLFVLLPQKTPALLALILFVVTFSIFLGPTFALIQRLVPAWMRATSMAVIILVANIIGMGCGPLIVGALSDFLTPRFGDDSLRYAMLALSSTALWSAYHFWAAGKSVTKDLAAAGAL